MVEAKVIGGQFFSFLYSFDYLSTEVNQRKTKRCNYPNSLTDNKKGDISVALCTLAPSSELELRNEKTSRKTSRKPHAETKKDPRFNVSP
jgi:hypothetical protein